ncbi:MAG: DNA polymerase II small subunit [Promethearchaeota archaeon]|nr:MAG: DNA polymerase II small subunit [Candidatus Lokiarchaeota archaeon]
MEKTVQVDVKSHLIEKFTQSGINLTPKSLQLILALNDPIKKGKKIIKQSTTIPEFKSHLTLEILEKIEDKEIKELLEEEFENIRDSMRSEVNQYDKSDIEDLEELIQKKLAKEIEIEKTFNTSPQKVENEVESKSQKDVNKNKKPEDLDLESNPPEGKNGTSKNIKNPISEKKSKINVSSTKSSFSFSAVAKDYDFDFKILKDPTGQIWTSGDYDDFYELTVDKFEKLKNLMKKRPGASAATNIINLKRLNEESEVSVIGLVDGLRQTKNGHFFMTLEDLTGNINVLVNKSIEIQEFRKTTESIINDQMILIKGTFKPGEKGKRGIIFADEVYKIDIPMNYNFTRSSDPLSIALLSDLHVGSREFEEKLWYKFIDFLQGRFGSKSQRKIAGKIKYIIINGDLVDGVGVYPNQEEDLVISDIYQQYEKVAELLSEVPEYIKIIYSPGNHEPVRNALPRPVVDKKYIKPLLDLGVECVGNPCLIETHNVKNLVYHGDSLLDLNLLVPGLDNNRPEKSMKELLVCRHLAPIYGKKTQIAPTSKDWLVIDEIPGIFHCGHIHINGRGEHRGVQLINSGCFQSQTEFMRSFGIEPTPGKVPIVELDTLNSTDIKLK